MFLNLVVIIISRFGENKSTDLMNIHVFIYKILAPQLLLQFQCSLIKNSLSKGIFPECFKTAKIIPTRIGVGPSTFSFVYQ